MKIKRVVTLLLCIGCLVASTGCGSVDLFSGGQSGKPNQSQSSGQGGQSSGEGGEEGGESVDKYTGAITNALPYSEGYTFVSDSTKHDSWAQFYGKALQICLNAKGEEVFRLSGQDVCRAGFKDGNALVEIKDEGGLCLMNTKGEIVVSPKKSGYTDGLIFFSATYPENDMQAYNDGYFPVYNKKSTFSGTTYEYGVMGANGEWILELSDSYFTSQVPSSKDLTWGASEYYNGFLHFKWSSDYDFWWNLKDGSCTYSYRTDGWASDYWTHYETADLEYGYRGASKFYDKAGDLKLDVSAQYPTMIQSGNFLEGVDCTIVRFSSGGNYFFSLMNRSGELLFEPFTLKKATLNVLGNYANGLAGMDENAKVFYAIKEDGTLVVYNKKGEKIMESPSLISASVTSAYVKASVDQEIYTVCQTSDGLRQITKAYFVNKDGKVILG